LTYQRKTIETKTVPFNNRFRP